MEEKIHVQVKDNSPSIERILRPITYISWFLGVGIAHPRKCPKAITIIIRIIYMIACFFFAIKNVKMTFSYDKKLDIIDYLYCTNEVMCYVATYYYIYHGIGQYNKWLELMDRLKELDQKIKKEISINDRSIKIVVALAVFAMFTAYFLLLIFYFLYHYLYKNPGLLYSISWPDFVLYYMLCQSWINSFVFDVIVYVLYRRFQTINKLIGQLDKLSDVLLIAFKIRGIRKLHTDICDLVNMLNDIHSFHLLLCSVNCFIAAVDTLFEVYIFETDYRDYWYILLQNFFFIAYVTQFFLICWICTLGCQESNRTGRIIYEIILNYKPANLDNHEARNESNLEMRPPPEDLGGERSFNRSHNLGYDIMENPLRGNLDQECVTKEINDFSIQLQHNRVAFTACDFFEINNALFATFIEVIVTYLLVVSQLYNEPKDLNTLKKFILNVTEQMYS